MPRTPGDWQIADQNLHTDIPIVPVERPSLLIATVHLRSDAELIALAPKLFGIVQDFVEWNKETEWNYKSESYWKRFDAIIDNMRSLVTQIKDKERGW